MMKAFVLISTFLLNLFSGDLPKINSADGGAHLCGKSIKAEPLQTCHSHGATCPAEEHLVPYIPIEKPPGSYQLRTVVIDPGHGGHDPGCLGGSSQEKHVVLAIGKYLAEGIRLMHPEVNVIMTRSEDVFVPLHERADIATRNHADLFISIHCNAFSSAHAKGTETYVLGLHATEANLEVAKRENEAILLEDNYQENYGYDPNSPEAHILFSMFQNAFLEQSISFAEKVQSNASYETGLNNRGVKQAGFLVLRHATMPSVLVETGYLTNGSDELYLMTDQGQKEMANALLLAFSDYKYDMNVGNSVAGDVDVPSLPQRKPVVRSQPPAKKETRPKEAKVVNVKQEEIPMAQPKKERKRSVTLAISPPPETPKKEEPAYVPYVPKTNTSPAKKSKIMATQPVSSHSDPTYTEAKKEAPAATVIEPAVQFCVQLAASPKLMDVSSGKWVKIDQTVEVVSESNLFKYQIRNFRTYDEAESVRRELRSKGFSDAFLVAYRNGEKVDPRKFR